ncbi:ABC transporter ATP-binding protein [Pararhodospirillum oryzae]|uniref:Lipoprotein inner membrane ABC transporter n=1 Tax=Pararhodospirillum oryzae TaxID=478448 RepID=A0A512H348_9PROT|nr:ABC transporter ATP-binding protein [Pararhodospirillum oryzae]GEO79875.1 lipoprotein inner membrane ABC transporter [Pararhodospirillum oryzae]
MIPLRPGLWGLMAPVRGRIILAMALAALGMACSITAVVALAAVLDLVRGGTPDLPLLDAEASAPALGFLAAALILAGLSLRTVSFIVSHRAAFDLEEGLRLDLADHLARLPLGILITTGPGALTKIIQGDVRALHAFVADSTPLVARNVAAPVVSLAWLLVIDIRLALVALAVFAAGMMAMRLAMKDYATLRQRYDHAREAIQTAVIEFVQAMPVVRLFDDASTSFGRYQRALEDFRLVFKGWVQASGVAGRVALLVLSPLPTLITVLAVGLVLMAGGSLGFAGLAAVLMLSTGVADALLPLMWMSEFIRKSRAGALRIHELARERPLPEPAAPRVPADASLVFDAVRFTYPGRETPALDGVGFSVAPGSVCAVVGPSGAGKSTLARLIPRFWDVDSGAIRVGGVDVRECATDTLMNRVSFVFQETFLFHGSVLENIRMGRPGASLEDVQAAARAAQIHTFIESLPEGYDTLVGERGARLSGGQRQRLTIARALLRDAPILVLDEATAFADAENETLLVQALATLMRGRTVLIIAHRLSTIRDADQIVVLDQGCLVEQGRHDDLLARNGLYARLWQTHQAARSWTLRLPSSGVLA